MKAFTRYFLSVLLLLVLWKLLSLSVSEQVLPSPERAFSAMAAAVKTRTFWFHFGVSFYRVTLAMLIAWCLAFPLGVILGYNRLLDKIISPSVFLTYPVPKIVLLPIFLMVFGLGDLSKILMISLIVGYQILVAARDSCLGLDKKYLDSFRSLGGGGVQLVQHVLIPSALPPAFTALRISCGTGIAVLFFVESFATEKGLGYFIMDSWGRASTELMFVGIIGMSLLGILLYESINYLERHLCAWKFLESGRRIEKGGAAEMMGRINVFGRMIKFSHTIFALPFALAAVILAQRSHGLSLEVLFWILVAMVGARSAAMGFNRIADARIDAKNPRTAQRALATGAISMKSAALFVLIFSGLFVLAAGMISRTCLVLSVPVLIVLFSYSYTKRFTSLSHLYLGFSISLAPLGAWIAVTGGFYWPIVVLSLALLTYIAGFDILYACQDQAFDREQGLFSVPARFGLKAAFHLSTLLHVGSFVFFFLLLILFDLGGVYFLALAVIGVLLIVEHRLVRPYDMANIKIAFFHVNSAISIVLLLGVLGDEIVRRLL